ncbi:MAG: hypothetical protein ACTSRG_02290 [Candidatus Helarchaeota archaeon]
MDNINKNLEIVKNYLKTTITEANEELSKHFKSTLIGSSLIEPIFRLLIGPDQTKKTIEMLEKILSFSREYNYNIEDFEDKLDEILVLDPTYNVLRKKMKVFDEAVGYLKDSYRNRIKFYGILLKGIGKDWKELYRTAFENKENILKNIKPEIEALDNLKNLVKKNRRLINVSGFVRADVIDAMFLIQDYTKKSLLEIPEEVF